MGYSLTEIFTKISTENFDIAIQSSILLAAAASIYYFFFGRLFSLAQILSNILRWPGCTLYFYTAELSRYSFVILSGFIFATSLTKTLYHEHYISFYPYDDDLYLQNLSTLRLIISGILIGLGSQIVLIGRENNGVLGLPTFSIRSLFTTFVIFGTTVLTVTYKVASWIPKTPRIIQIANNSLPKNISFDSYMLVALLVPFIVFLVSSKKSLKGLIECLLYFVVGGLISLAFMYLGLSQIQKTLSYFRYNKKWTADIPLVLGVASFMFAIVFAIVKYGFKKPLFSNRLHDRKSKITPKLFLGSLMIGLGFGLGGLIFQSFLLTVPSSTLRIVVFWAIPYIFSMKAVQYISQKSQIPIDPKTS